MKIGTYEFQNPNENILMVTIIVNHRSCRRQMFFSPTQKMKEDVKYLNNGLRELNLISEDIIQSGL